MKNSDSLYKHIQEWWDSSTDAGPSCRPETPFPEACPTLKLLAFEGQKVASLNSK